MGIHSRHSISVGPIVDPTADEKYLIARVPKGAGKWTLVGASASLTEAITSDATSFVGLRLAKRGVNGTTTAVNISSVLGGASSAWGQDTPRDFTITEAADANVLEPGEYIELTYDEGGTVAPGEISVFLELAPGVA